MRYGQRGKGSSPALRNIVAVVVLVLGAVLEPRVDPGARPHLEGARLSSATAEEGHDGRRPASGPRSPEPAGLTTLRSWSPMGAGATPRTGSVAHAAPGTQAAGGRQRYIVVLDPNVGDPRAVAEHSGGEVGHLYRFAVKGFSVTLPPEAAAALRRDRRVRSVEPDQVARVVAQQVPTGVDRVAAPDQRSGSIPHLSIDGRDDLRVDADIAILDTGVASHTDLNVVARTDCVSTFWSSGSSCRDGRGDDRHGHGTHVAGTAAALDNGSGVVGVATGARLHAVRVLGDNGSGSFSDIIAGIDWVTSRARTIDVVNLSLGCLECPSPALDSAIARSVTAGVTYVVAAGNDAVDAHRVTPANHGDVITVSALADFDGASGGKASSTCRYDRDDTLAGFSNFGGTIDIAAPGVCIRSTAPGGRYATMSGTSMAAPHVAGAAAILAATGKAPAAIRDTVVSTGSRNWTDDSGDAVQEPLLDVSSSVYGLPGAAGGTTTTTSTTTTTTTTTSTSTTTTTTTQPPGNRLPTASFTTTCYDNGCIFDGRSSSDSDGRIRSFEWTFGDGSAGSGSYVSHRFGSAGSYQATLTVTDDAGAQTAAARTVTCSASGGRLACR